MLLTVDDLSVTYPTPRGTVRALDGISFALDRGGSLGLVGESGSGKSTTALALMGLLDPAASPTGQMLFDGQDLAGLSPEAWRRLRGRRMAMVFQDPFTTLNPALLVGDQIGEPLVHHRALDRGAARARAIELLAEIGIAHPEAVAASYPHQLSGGMRQRALIATALAGEPELLILDEPTTALDVTIEAQILDLLAQLQQTRRMALLFISHNLGTVRRLCAEVAIIYAGRLVERGPTAEIFAAPHHPYTKGLLASLPRIAERRRRLAPIPGTLPDPATPSPGCNFAPRCPFAEPACEAARIVLEQTLHGRLIRCRREAALRDAPWPTADEPPRAASAPTAEPPTAEPIVAVRGLSRIFRRGGGILGWRRGESLVAVDRVDLDIAPGEVLGLVGESGSGKTTLGRTILRLIRPSAGTIRIAGTEIAALPERQLQATRRVAQIVFQNPDSALNPRKTVGALIGRPLRRFRLAPPAEIPARVAELLDLVRLPRAYAERYPHQLSGGEKQRVGIARAIATEPRFIVCDEPVSALDVSVQAAILNLLADLRDRTGAAYLFISHDIAVIAHLADRVAVLYRGGICEIGRTTEVLAPPYHPYTEALLSAVPQLDDGAGDRRIRLSGEIASDEVAAGCRFHHRCPRKLGAVCETTAPPIREPAPGHRIACHIPVDTLAALPRVI